MELTMSRTINVHTHYQPRSVLDIVKPYSIEMTTRDGGWYFRSGDLEYRVPGTPENFGERVCTSRFRSWTRTGSTCTFCSRVR